VKTAFGWLKVGLPGISIVKTFVPVKLKGATSLMYPGKY
jgi:hypothetical protein